MKRIFLICPVRGLAPELEAKILTYVKKLEDAGNWVYWPKRDTNQDDPIGLKICVQNRAAIAHAQEVHVWYDKSSEGSKFDLGMTFMALYSCSPGQQVVLANPDEVRPTPHKSFENVLIALAKGSR